MRFSNIKTISQASTDRAYWDCGDQGDEAGFPVCYLGWGRRNFVGEHIPVESHKGWVCVIIQEGSPTIVFEDQSIRLSRGSLVFVHKDCPFGWKQENDESFKFLLWIWRNPLLPRFSSLLSNSRSIHRVPMARRAIWAQLHAQCRDELIHQDKYSLDSLECCQRQIEILLLRLMDSDLQGNEDVQRLNLALGWMNRNPGSSEPVSRLCDYLGTSHPNLYRFFKEQTGDSPLASFHRIKMEHAIRLLQRPGIAVKEVAFTLGYLHSNDFSRAYRQFYGVSPSQHAVGRTR
jgi:AraC-like DNA-binding protein